MLGLKRIRKACTSRSMLLSVFMTVLLTNVAIPESTFVNKMREHILPKDWLELIWTLGTAQVDFGDADFIIKGEKTRLKYLVVYFPYSNNSFCRLFG